MNARQRATQSAANGSAPARDLTTCARNHPFAPEPAERSSAQTLTKQTKPVIVDVAVFASGPRYRGSNPCLPANHLSPRNHKHLRRLRPRLEVRLSRGSRCDVEFETSTTSSNGTPGARRHPGIFQIAEGPLDPRLSAIRLDGDLGEPGAVGGRFERRDVLVAVARTAARFAVVSAP
jgi:hypothetical protein